MIEDLIVRALIRFVSIAILLLILALSLTGCGPDIKLVPQLVTLPQAEVPKECLRQEHRNLHNLPEMRADETVEDYVVRIGTVHRMNVTRYRYVHRNKRLCRKFVKAL